jgi:two-component system, cell cycle response regulator DivK
MSNKVLIIDDDARNIFALAATLKAKKIPTVSAGSAVEGFELLEKDPGINVVLMDMMMPGMDGYEAMNMIRQHDKFRDIYLIAVTAQAMTGDKEKCLAAGADEYISKPIDVDKLLSLLAKA